MIINGKNFYDQPIDSDLKRYDEIRKLTTAQGEDYTTGCLLDFDYIKNHYRLIPADLSRQKELDADPKAIQQIEFVGQLKNIDRINAYGIQSMFILTILEKITERRRRRIATWIIFNNETNKTTKIRNAFANNMSTDIKFSKAQISKIIQSGGSFGSWLAKWGKKAPTNVAIHLARDNLSGLVSNIASNAINKFERKLSGKGAVRPGKRFTLFILNEDMDGIIKIIKSLEASGALIDGVTEQ